MVPKIFDSHRSDFNIAVSLNFQIVTLADIGSYGIWLMVAQIFLRACSLERGADSDAK
jgi:hypothetical protein